MSLPLDAPRTRTTHGKCPRGRQPKKYTVWCNIKRRISDPNHPAYKDYGGRGITMNAEWFASFAAFDADVPDPPEDGFNCTLDRIENDCGYEPGNVRWVDRKTQANNRRAVSVHVGKPLEYAGRTQNLAAWCRELGLNYQTTHCRIRKGWSVVDAFAGVKSVPSMY